MSRSEPHRRGGRAGAALLCATLACVGGACGDDDGAGNHNQHTGRDAAVLDAWVPGDASPLPEGSFRHGVNFGHRNAAWGDPSYAELAARVGCDSARLSLPERHLDQWGYDIELGDVQQYAALGFGNHVAFLSSPIRAHSTAPSSAADWELAYYQPANLYEPIWSAPGEVNPENYWAWYVHETVRRYHPWIRTWEVWNEPDWVSDWQVTQTWDTDPPLTADLPRWNGTIYDYVRMLRVTYEVVKAVDPTGQVATGGLGYPSFLAALLRYTDNPVDGSVTAEYPQTGGAYFDVLSFHHYPLYTAGSSEAAVDGFLAHRDAFQEELDSAGVVGKTWVVTESGAPHVQRSGEPSGSEYARNYLLKVMALAPLAGIGGVDWFLLTDTATPGEETSAYQVMGLYEDIVDLDTIAQAIPTEPGWAYATLGAALRGATADAAATTALGLPAGTRGVAFRLADGVRRAWVLWAVPTGSDEAASATYSLAVSGTVRIHRWDAAATGDRPVLSPAGGAVEIPLTGTPVIVTEE